MKKTLLIIGLVLAAAGIVCFVLSGLFRYSYMHVLDGSPELFARLRRRYLLFLYCGIGGTVSGVLCLLLRRMLR